MTCNNARLTLLVPIKKERTHVSGPREKGSKQNKEANLGLCVRGRGGVEQKKKKKGFIRIYYFTRIKKGGSPLDEKKSDGRKDLFHTEVNRRHRYLYSVDPIRQKEEQTWDQGRTYMIRGAIGANFMFHIINVNTGEDVTMKFVLSPQWNATDRDFRFVGFVLVLFCKPDPKDEATTHFGRLFTV
uniref:Uncharacterized protein n=1 Tax=Tanacetum cinerariifolium TaxID=118510 RepID=A0A6L2NC93_TANCI|nr:hypothetical protein [Tanacetum cinerariifolium]